MKIEIIAPMQDYFRSVNFLSKGLRDQVSYLMFYVTEIAKLRDNMTAEVITDRINDQIAISNSTNYGTRNFLKINDIEDILQANDGYFVPITTYDTTHSDRGADLNKIPYSLSEEKKESLRINFNNTISNIENKINKQKKTIQILFLLSIMCILMPLSSIFFNKNIIDNLSWNEYKTYSNFDKSNDFNKTLFVLYYITEVTHLNNSMTIEVLKDRVEDIDGTVVDYEKLKKSYENSSFVIVVDINKSKYKLSQEGVRYLDETITRNYKEHNEITPMWLFNNMSIAYWPVFFAMFSGAFWLGISIRVVSDIGKLKKE